MEVSIVISNYFLNKSGRIVPDGDEQMWFAKNCFERLRMYTKIPYELILVDNGSIHGRELLEQYADILVVVSKNQGFAHGVNQGLKRATGEWVCVMNNDIFVYEGWLEALMKTFEDNPRCGVAMPALMKQTKRGDEALKIDKPDLSRNYYEYGEGAEFGSCWLTKKEIVDKVGLLDENFRCGFGEDRQYWDRIRMAGYETYRTHKTRVFHQGNVSMSKIPNRKKYTIPNRRYLKKWREEVQEKRGTLTEKQKRELREKIQKDYEAELETM